MTLEIGVTLLDGERQPVSDAPFSFAHGDHLGCLAQTEANGTARCKLLGMHGHDPRAPWPPASGDPQLRRGHHQGAAAVRYFQADRASQGQGSQALGPRVSSLHHGLEWVSDAMMCSSKLIAAAKPRPAVRTKDISRTPPADRSCGHSPRGRRESLDVGR